MDSPWTPLRIRVFRWIWLATLVSNVGTWMQTVGAQWLLVGRPNASALVALVQTAATLPVLLLALPAGVLADVLDRRWLLIGSQLFQTAVAGVMAALAATGHLPPGTLLALTFALGCGATLSLPAQQAIIPELVPREDLAAASALGGMNQNVARAIGPALAGLVVARVGASAVFGLNAVSFVVLALILVGWRPQPREGTEEPERVSAALRAGTRYIRHSPVIRRILLCVCLFTVPASALWSLLPVVAEGRLGLGAGGYGLLLAALGIGAVVGAVALPRIRARLSDNQMCLLAYLVFALVIAVTGTVRNVAVVAVVLLPGGVAWIAVLATMNAAMQLFLPNWVRARGLSVYQVVLFGGMAVASGIWGQLAERSTLPVTFGIAAGVLVAGAGVLARRPLAEVGHLDRSLAVYWPEPHLVLDPARHGGPVLVTVTYQVAPANVAAFVTAMARVRRSRLRTGAVRWELYRDGADPASFVEQYVVRSWDEHLRQHQDRLTGTDQAVETEARALAEGPPLVAHLFPPTEALAPDPGPGAGS